MGQQVRFAHESVSRTRIALLGTSGHAFRNYLPVFPFLPVELVGVWDPDQDLARAFAMQFGAGDRAYDDVGTLLRDQRPDAVVIGSDAVNEDGRTRQTELVMECLHWGCHVFCDKPVASTVSDVRGLIRARDHARRVVGIGIKTMHYPTHSRAHDIVNDPNERFGDLASISIKYPLHVPSTGGRIGSDPVVRSCLGHVWHPFGTALRIAGPLASLRVIFDRGGNNSIVTARFRNGAVGTFHFPRTRSSMSPLEHVEVVGQGAEIVIDNAVRITYYRRASPGPYGRTIDMLTPLETAPIVWTPEFTLGQLYNNHNFIQGYGQSVAHFLDAITANQPVTIGSLEDALEILKIHEALCAGPDEEVVLAQN